jgi:hypothetical protein
MVAAARPLRNLTGEEALAGAQALLLPLEVFGVVLGASSTTL